MNNNLPEDNTPKKKISKYEIFRRIMLVICICLVAALLIRLAFIISDYIKARKVSSEVLGGVVDITKPPMEGSTPSTTPIKIEETPTDTERPDHVNSEYFSQWLKYIRETKEKYPDFIGYIEIENLDILYPIVQTDNNDYYLDHLIDGTSNKNGEIFMDHRNNASPLTDNQNIVIYGHNLGDGTKFHNLTKLRKEENFYNSPINIITEEGIFTFTIFSFYKTDSEADYAKLKFDYYSNFGMFCVEEQNKSMHESNFKFTGKEVIITLSTCVNEFGGRWCTHAVLTNISQ